MIRNIVLDWGLVLAYPTTGNWFATPQTADILGAINTRRLAEAVPHQQAVIDKAMKQMSADHLLVSMQDEERVFTDFFKTILTGCGICTASENSLAQEIAGDLVWNPEHVKLYADVKEVLKQMKEAYEIYILSDNWPSFYEKMNTTGVNQFIEREKTVISSDYCICKTDVRLFEIAVDKWKINPEESAFVDDNMANLANAEKAGFYSILMDRTGEKVEKQYPIAHNLKDVFDLLSTFSGEE